MKIKKFASKKTELVVTAGAGFVVLIICALLIWVVIGLVNKAQRVFAPPKTVDGYVHFNFEEYEKITGSSSAIKQ